MQALFAQHDLLFIVALTPLLPSHSRPGALSHRGGDVRRAGVRLHAERPLHAGTALRWRESVPGDGVFLERHTLLLLRALIQLIHAMRT